MHAYGERLKNGASCGVGKEEDAMAWCCGMLVDKEVDIYKQSHLSDGGNLSLSIMYSHRPALVYVYVYIGLE